MWLLEKVENLSRFIFQTSVRLRATDGTADVSIGIAPRQAKALPTELRAIPGSTSPGTTSRTAVTSRRSSIHSEVSSVSAKSRSILSGEGEKQPILEGNVQLTGGFECGERVISVLHTPDGNAVGKFVTFFSFSH